MLRVKQILVSALVLVVCMVSLSGCGQTGSLYLPKRPAPAGSVPAAGATSAVPLIATFT
ncbi:MAG: lipoprotein [Burkholderiales bacterium]|nr:lipoprotein [Burkholderiales bacterium]MBL0245939.1 lipoprotein [Rhodoferax sp.]